jgi:hypothetical protein
LTSIPPTSRSVASLNSHSRKPQPHPMLVILKGSWVRIRFQRFSRQGCQMAHFQTNNPNLGKFWRVLRWKILLYFTPSWSVLQPFSIFCGHLVYLMVTYLVYFSCCGMLYQEKSGNPVSDSIRFARCQFLWRVPTQWANFGHKDWANFRLWAIFYFAYLLRHV